MDRYQDQLLPDRLQQTPQRPQTCRRSLRFHNLTMSELELREKEIFGGKFKEDIDNMIRQYNQLMAILDSEKEILEDLEDTNEVLLNTKTNNIMKVITILGFVVAPMFVALEILRYPIENIEHTWISAVVTVGLALITSLSLWYYLQQRKDL